MLLVVRLLESLSVADDGPLAAYRTQPRQQFQRDLGYPGSLLFSVSGSAMKRTTADGRSAENRPSVSIERLIFTSW